MISFHVRGNPVPMGSVTGGIKASGGVYIRQQKAASLREWQRAITDAAREAFATVPTLRGPVRVNARFTLQRPKAHWSAKGGLKANAPVWHTTKPDRDKLLRALCDALTNAAVIADDSLIVDGWTSKTYTAEDGISGVFVQIEEVTDVVSAR